MMTDPIADMLTRIRNANAVSQEETGMPSSKLKETIADLLVAEGYLDGYEVKPAGPGRELKVTLRYGANQERVIPGDSQDFDSRSSGVRVGYQAAARSGWTWCRGCFHITGAHARPRGTPPQARWRAHLRGVVTCHV